MKQALSRFLLLSACLGFVCCSSLFCNQTKQESAYLNHHDTVKYVGMETCRSCHSGIYDTYIRTGMGKSFGAATASLSTADFSSKHTVYDSINDFYYSIFKRYDSLYVREFRLSDKDTTYQRVERIDYIVGSGQHTHSHLQIQNGYINQLPLTWYAQERKWDLPPGFEAGRSKRFNRLINVECMSCHNAMPAVHPANDEKFLNIPQGIDCERCHGPGEAHVNRKLAGEWIDTATHIDYSIVNPKKLSWERQIDLCQRCHLQGNAILKPGKQFTDFRPGQKLSDFVDVFMPKYTGNTDEFIMASHAQRLQMSKCFTQTATNIATQKLTCITCHNPHVSVKETGTHIFNQACYSCHDSKTGCKTTIESRTAKNDNCVSCHMQLSGTIDIPHVTVHDHKIKIPQASASESEKVKTFAGLYCVNNPNPDVISRAQAFINYYEKFEGEPEALDSALYLLRSIRNDKLAQSKLIHVLYLKNDFNSIVAIAGEMQSEKCNEPWLAYRIGASYQQLQALIPAEIWLQRAVTLSPDYFEFINKLGANYYIKQDLDAALRMFNWSLSIYPNQPEIWSNAGYIYFIKKQHQKAYSCYQKALALNPDSQAALANMARYYAAQKNTTAYQQTLSRLNKLMENKR